jgi:hypothetical protein
MIKYLLISFLTLLVTHNVFAQDRFVDKGEHVATFPIQFKNGFLLVTLPILDTNEIGEKITIPRSFLLDPAISNDGNFVPLDSNGLIITRAIEFRVPVSDSRTIKLELVQTEAREAFRNMEKNFMGVLGYSFIKRYRTIIDITRKEMRLYTLASDITYSKTVDTSSTRTYYFDDAIINYCSCQFPSMWLEVKAPPIKEGRVHLSLADNQSTIFRDALDKATLAIIEKEERADSLAGKQNFAGISVGQFYVGEKNIAGRNPRRAVVKRPAKFKDLNIEVIGTLAMDVLRTYQAIIIDPTRYEMMMVR